LALWLPKCGAPTVVKVVVLDVGACACRGHDDFKASKRVETARDCKKESLLETLGFRNWIDPIPRERVTQDLLDTGRWVLERVSQLPNGPSPFIYNPQTPPHVAYSFKRGINAL
jgi:hypothetical protein